MMTLSDLNIYSVDSECNESLKVTTLTIYEKKAHGNLHTEVLSFHTRGSNFLSDVDM